MSVAVPNPSPLPETNDPLAHAQAALAASEARYRALVQSFSEAVWSYGPVSGFEPGIQWWCALTGQTPEESGNEGWFTALHPDDRSMAIAAWRRSVATGTPYDVEYRVRTASGDYRSFAVRGVPTGEGAQRGWVGTFTDITARKLAEAALQETSEHLRALSRRLLAVQEQERRFVAAELHDEVGQLLTGLNYQIELAARAGASPPLAAARAIVQDLTARVRALSQRLRPTVLDDLGLSPAISWLVDRMKAQNDLSVSFDHRGLDGRLPAAVETAAFRIVQEALTNVARHAGVSAASVVLARDADTLEVRISDAGQGFQVAQIDVHNHGGLSGMRERAAWLGGRLTIQTAPRAGVRITASLPIAAD